MSTRRIALFVGWAWVIGVTALGSVAYFGMKEHFSTIALMAGIGSVFVMLPVFGLLVRGAEDKLRSTRLSDAIFYAGIAVWITPAAVSIFSERWSFDGDLSTDYDLSTFYAIVLFAVSGLIAQQRTASGTVSPESSGATPEITHRETG